MRDDLDETKSEEIGLEESLWEFGDDLSDLSDDEMKEWNKLSEKLKSTRYVRSDHWL
jgi:hypothetical protein